MAPVTLGGLTVIVLATGPKVRRIKPSQEQWIFKGDKSYLGGVMVNVPAAEPKVHRLKPCRGDAILG
jgi:hypothetical protein